MEKNVVVVDEYGNRIGLTYPKRAKGLVKKGRARYADASTICLACPPNTDLEDIYMKDTINTNAAAEENISEVHHPAYDIAYIMKQIEAIRQDTGYLYQAIEQLGTSGNGEKAMAIGEIVTQRDKTNQQLIDFYRRTMLALIQAQSQEKEISKAAMADKLITEIKTSGIPGVQEKLSQALNHLMTTM